MILPMLEKQQLISEIDKKVNDILLTEGEEGLLMSLYDLMPDIKKIMDSSSHGELNGYCQKYEGFLKVAKLLEEIAVVPAENSSSLETVLESSGNGPKIVLEDKINNFIGTDRINSKNYHVTAKQINYYKHVCVALRNLYPKFMSELDREVADCCAKKLDILQGNSLLLNTEHEMRLFYDYCIYNYKLDGLNVIQRGVNSFSGNYTGEDLKFFKAAKNGYFAYLEIIKPANASGFVVYDRARNEEHLMLDNGLSILACSASKYAIVTNIIVLDDFIMTTGASTPVPVDTESGLKVQRRFAQYLKLLETGKVTKQDTAQYITDMYKICLHEDITGQVTSPAVPFGNEALAQRVMTSDLIN